MLSDRPLKDLLDEFSSSEPVPGGGSASALAAALGTSLLMMVAGLPKTRDNSEVDRAALAEARAALAPVRDRLIGLIDGDSQAYERVLSAYRLPKGTKQEQAARREAIETALQEAIDAPLEVMRGCAEALDRAAAVARHGNPSAASDIQVALELLGAAVRGARLNVETNLNSVRDEGYRAQAGRGLARLGAEADAGTSRALAELPRKG